MGQFGVFVADHWILWLAFIVIALALFVYERSSKAGHGNKVSPQDAIQLINRQHAIVIDVRLADEFKGGHIINSILMPFDELESKLKKFKKNKAKPVVVVCAAGIRAQKAAKILIEKEFKEVYVLAGGLNAWRQASFPLESS